LWLNGLSFREGEVGERAQRQVNDIYSEPDELDGDIQAYTLKLSVFPIKHKSRCSGWLNEGGQRPQALDDISIGLGTKA
jgi:hypothetical protein